MFARITVTELAYPPGAVGHDLALHAVNTVGAFALGTLLAALPPTAVSAPGTPAAPAWRTTGLRLFFGTGFLGGFTSYSALVQLAVPAGELSATAFGLGLLSVLIAVVAAAAGVFTGTRINRRHQSGSAEPGGAECG